MKKKGLGLWILPILSLLVMILMYLFAVNENEAWKSMKNIWETGESTQAAVELEGDVSQRFSIRFYYTVDGTDYSSRTTLSEEDFALIDGEDRDGKGTAEARYDPKKPKNAVLEGSAACQAGVVDQRLYMAKVFFAVTLGCIAATAALTLMNRKKRY